MNVELLYFEGCPNHDSLLAHLGGLLASAGTRAEITLVEVSDDDEAQRVRFLGSPTVRVNGRDVEPGAEARTDFGLRCRLYRTADGLSTAPLDAWVLAAVAAAAAG